MNTILGFSWVRLLGLAACLVGGIFWSQPGSLVQGQTPANAPPINTKKLLPGQKFGPQRIQGGEPHVFQIELAPGQYCEGVVVQDGVDLVVRVFQPDGHLLNEVDSPNSTEGPEPIGFIARMEGVHRIEIQALDPKAAGGTYEVTVTALRPATEADQARLQALGAGLAAFNQGQALQAQGTKEGLVQARTKYETARELFQQAGDRCWEATTVKTIGDLGTAVQSVDDILNQYQQALAMFESIQCRFGMANTFLALGTVYRIHRGRMDLAAQVYEQAKELFHTLNDEPNEMTALNNVAVMELYQEKAIQALPRLDLLLGYYRRGGPPATLAQTLNNLGGAYSKLGEYERALELYQEALQLRRKLNNAAGQAETLQNMGMVYSLLFEPRQARTFFEEALPLWQKIGDRRSEVVTLTSIGGTYGAFTQPEKVLEYSQRALAMYRQLGDLRGEASILRRFALFHLFRSEWSEALKFAEQAVILSQTLKDTGAEAEALTRKGSAYVGLHQYDLALTVFRDVLTKYQQIDNQLGTAAIQGGLSIVSAELQDLKQARFEVEEAIRFAETRRSKMALQNNQISLQTTLHPIYQNQVYVYVKSYQEDPSGGYEEKIFAACELLRARALNEAISENQDVWFQTIDPESARQIREIRQEINQRAAQALRAKAAGEKATVQTLESEIDRLQTTLNGMEMQLRRRNPRWFAYTQSPPVSLQRVQSELLAPDALLVEFCLVSGRIAVISVTKQDFAVALIEITEAQLVQAVQRLNESLTARNQVVAGETLVQQQARIAAADARWMQEAAQVSSLLLGPIAGKLKRYPKVLIVADGILQNLAFGVLPNPNTASNQPSQPLIVTHEVTMLPSATTLELLRSGITSASPSEQSIAIVADPVFSADDQRLKAPGSLQPPVNQNQSQVAMLRPRDIGLAQEAGVTEKENLRIRRLPGTRQEATAIAQLFPARQTTLWLDFNASREAVLHLEPGKYRFLHFATHGLVNNTHPALSGLIFSTLDPNGKPQEAFLRVHDISNLKLPAELTVLSACQTALGANIQGEGIVGLARGFMCAGSKRVIASLWSVNDASTARLMTEFYRIMVKQKKSPAAALRLAQIAMWKQNPKQNPYYWGGFVLQGEYQ
ncbi:MAG: CHAT domain-containing protein [Blastocatellia bacterium]|nr:CHAT domain-containing protein [Blastocatellia bacterium]